MTKVKERKSESWKPGLLHDDGFISKNKKRKEKRMSLNLSAKKMDSDEFIPIKKSMLALGKAKDGSSSFLSPALDKKQTPKKKDTPLPTLSGKNQNIDSAPNKRKLSVAVDGIPKNKHEPLVTPKKKVDSFNNLKSKGSGTPKTKTEPFDTPKNKAKPQTTGTPQAKLEPSIKSSLRKNSQKFIDYEAEEGEEPVSSKNVKQYEKGQKRKSISFKFDDKKEESESDDDDNGSGDSDEITDARNFFDNEASEGEETEDESGSEEEEDDDEDDSKDDLYKSFVNGEDGSESDEDSEDGDEEEEESDDDSESDEEERLPRKVQEKKKADIKTNVKPVTVPTVPNKNKKDKTENLPEVNETTAKKVESKANVIQKDTKQKKKPAEEKPSADETSMATSNFAGYIKFLPKTITVDQIKSQLSTEISSKNIVSIILKKTHSSKSNKCLVYVTDSDSLEDLENKSFTIGQTHFKIYKARESKKVEKTKPLIFLPRVPLSIDKAKLESLIADDIGAENIVKFKNKGTNNKLNARNVVIELANHEILKKIIYKGSYTCDGKEIIVRQAFESGFQVPIYKVVFSGVPEKASEVIIKKAVEARVGQDTVINVKFSFNNRSFAFVSLNNEEAQKKLLKPGTEISIKGTKVAILEFKPRVPKKRGPAKKKAKEGPATKKLKTDDSTPAPIPNKSKNKKKHSKTVAQPNSSPVKKQPKSETQNNAPNASPKKQKPLQQLLSPSSPSKNKKVKKDESQVPDKKANLSNKLEAKKNKFKNKKMKKKQAASDE